MSDLASTYDDINHIDAMQGHLVFQKQQYKEITEQIAETERTCFQLGQRMQQMKDRMSEGASHIPRSETESDGHSPVLLQQLAELQTEYERLTQKKEQLIRRQQVLNEDMVLQQQAIAGEHLKRGVSFDGLLQHQENIKIAEQEIRRLEQLISEQIPAINSLLIAKGPIDGLLEQKEDILAEIAQGTNLESELEQVDKQIGEALAKIKQAEERAHKAEATQDGLKRKLAHARQDLAILEAKTPRMLEILLHSMAENEGQLYFKLAEQIQRSYTRLMGLDGLIKQHGSGKGISVSNPELRLPVFNLQAVNAQGGQKDGCLFDWRIKFFYGNGQREAMTEELSKIREAGVTVI